jgi:acetyl esterase/lipase
MNAQLPFRILVLATFSLTGSDLCAQTNPDEKVVVPRFERKGPLTVTVPTDLEIIPDLEYGTGGERPLRLDVVKPKAPGARPRPLLVWIHGGAWGSGNKEGGVEGLLWFAQQGYVCATVEYRLSKEAPFPAQIHDCKAAIRYLRANAARFGIDPQRIGVWGSSAGAHLAALLGTSGDTDQLDGLGGTPGVSAQVQAVCDWFAPIDLLTVGHDETDQIKHNAANSPESKLIGGPVQENREKALRANPITYLSRNDPPFLVMHGDQDPTVPIRQSETFVKALRDTGVDVTYLPVPGGGHGKGFDTVQYRQVVLDFFDKHLKAN